MHHPVQARVGRVEHATIHSGACHETVCTCNPDVHWTRSFTRTDYSVHHYTIVWLLCHLVDSSAREPKKDAPSCDKPQGAAWKLRTEDLRMGIPSQLPLRNRERRELKHLSTDRKRKQTAMSLVTASEDDTVQTEAFTGNVVFGLATIDYSSTRSLLERSVIQGDNPVSSTRSRGSTPEYRGSDIPREFGWHPQPRLNIPRDR